MELFRGIAGEGTAVLMVTHELDTLRYGDRVYSMDAGNLRAADRAG
jgi:putative ABC transport system ATP-binding protein